MPVAVVIADLDRSGEISAGTLPLSRTVGVSIWAGVKGAGGWRNPSPTGPSSAG